MSDEDGNMFGPTTNGRTESEVVLNALAKDKDAVSFDRCIDNYFAPDENREGYKCEQCGSSGTTTFADLIVDPPRCLNIGLKRFKRNWQGQYTKDCSRVVVSKEIDLAPFMADDVDKSNSKYTVYAMQRHFGSGMGGGHYTSRILVDPDGGEEDEEATVDPEGGEVASTKVWREFDDANVSELDTSWRDKHGEQLHETKDKRWDQSGVFASHLIYSVMFVRKEDVPEEDDDDDLMRTQSCYFEAKPKPFVFKPNKIGTAAASAARGLTSSSSYGASSYRPSSYGTSYGTSSGTTPRGTTSSYGTGGSASSYGTGSAGTSSYTGGTYAGGPYVRNYVRNF